MACITDSKIQNYIVKDLNSIESAIIRDHLLTCQECKSKYEKYLKLERHLENPVYKAPPAVIERNVLRRLFPVLPTYSSIIALITVSIACLVSFIYIYFDFANNSIIQALRLTSNNTSNWIASIIKVISSIFSGVYAVFKAVNSIISVIFNINIGVEVVASSFVMFFIFVLYMVYRLVFRRLRNQN